MIFYNDGSHSFGHFGELERPDQISVIIESPFDYAFMKSEKVKDIEFITPLCMLINKMFTNAKAALTR